MALPKGALLKEGRYRVQALLARGGFAFIYLALDRQTGRQVVLKELIPVLAYDVQVLRRFIREARTMQRLCHPSIARVEAMFRDQGNIYMVIEYLSAGSLADRLDQGSRLSLDQSAMVTISLCDALIYLHQKGIVHCDLNPSNVLFDVDHRPKLVDLGIAYVPDTLVHRSWHTERGFAMGTILYMAPEQLDGVRHDPSVDLYALGAMVYQMLAGRLYLDFDQQGTPSAQAHNVELVHRRAPTPIPNVPPEVNAVILRALAKSPQDRYPDVVAFRQRLVQALFAHLSPERGFSLVAPFQTDRARLPSQGEATGWPDWVWGALLALNLAVMAISAWLLFKLS